MILDRLTVREKVNLLALIPLLVSVLLLVPLVATRLDQARQAAQAADLAETTREVGALTEQMQQVRLLSVAYLGDRTVAPNALAVQLAEVQEARARLVDRVDPAAQPQLAGALRQIKLLTDVETAVTGRWLSGETAVGAYGSLIDPLIDSLRLGQAATTPENAQALGSLDALLRSGEMASRHAALLLVAAQNATDRRHALALAHDEQVASDALANQFKRSADPSATGLFALAESSQATVRLDDARVELDALGNGRLRRDLPAQLFAAAASQTQLRQLVETRVAQDVVTGAQRSLLAARLVTGGLAAVAGVLLFGVLLLSIRVGRSVSGPLRRLTGAAGAVADLAQEELLRVADEDNQEVVAPRLAAIDVHSTDEIGELAEAFNRVQATAALLLERQVVSRRNVASMFASVGRRTTNLIARQLALIDGLERAEQNPDTLATLYRLDHVATRLRRSASSLVVLSGATESIGEGAPMPVGDVVRSALGTVEEFQRVTLRRLPKLWVAPGVVGDLSLLLAELLENAVLFSPPRTQVEVVGSMARDGSCTLSITDHGMGMPTERLAEENARLRRRERLDLAPSDVLGLFVVGRIARRHQIGVHLEQTPPTGVTAVVHLPASVMVDGRVAGLVPSRPVNRHREAAVAAGTTRRELAARVGGQSGRSQSGQSQGGQSQGGQSGRSVPAAATGWPGGLPPAPGSPQQQPIPPTIPPTIPPVTPPASRPATPPESLPATPATAVPASEEPLELETAGQPGAGLTKRVRGANWKGGPIQPVDPARPDPARPAAVTPRPDAPQPPPGGEGVARRVPGSSLAEIERRTFPDGEATTTAPPVEGLDPVAARRQVEDVERAMVRAREVAEHGAPLPPPPTPAELGHSAGLRRRVPGAALSSLTASSPRPAPRPAAPGETGPLDAEQLRQALDDVDQAVARARDTEPAPPFTEQRLAEQAAEAAVRAAAGRRAEQTEAVEHLAEQLRTTATPTTARPEAETPAQTPTGAPASPPERPVVRRVPGASLAALGEGGGGLPPRTAAEGAPRNGAGSNGRPGRGRSGGPATGPIAVRPERPQDVLAWAQDLEAAMARLPDPAGPTDGPATGPDPGNGPGDPGSTDLADGRSVDDAGTTRPSRRGEDG